MQTKADQSSGFEPLASYRSWRLGGLRLTHDLTGRDGWRLDTRRRYRALEFSRFKFAISLNLFQDQERWWLQLFGLWIQLWRTKRKVIDQMLDSWGFSMSEDSLQLKWRGKTKLFWLPWGFEHINQAHKVLMDDKTWLVYPRWTMNRPTPEEQIAAVGKRWSATYPYLYMLSSGVVQERQAMVTVECRRWRRRCLPEWLPLFQIKKTSIDVTFNDEVGDRTGSWKGGALGCGYDMRPGETPRETLRRMERDRKFK